ncbi:uncharacterized protein bcl2l12 isoform X1 [Salvelinus alpinus]|uniref:uncharacterized protein bcl2l12 isoform X1 n=1 Tax=Salvelinus alpinus TaxID=8036 RepID=UPI0039FBCC54
MSADALNPTSPNPSVMSTDALNPTSPNPSVMSTDALNPTSPNPSVMSTDALNPTSPNPSVMSTDALNPTSPNPSVMSTDALNPTSPNPSVSSISLVEIKADTRLVLKAFLRSALSNPSAERLGTVGGSYKDHNKYSAKESRKRPDNGWDSLDEAISSVEEKKHGLKDLIKRRLQPRPSNLPLRRSAKDSGADQTQNGGSLEKDGRPNRTNPGLPGFFRDQLEEDVRFPSMSDEEGNDPKQQKKAKKLKSQISSFFSIRKKPEKDKDKDETRLQRPSTLTIGVGPVPGAPVISPTHPPEFYEEVAETLDRIAQRSHSMKRPQRSSPRPSPATTPVKPPPGEWKHTCYAAVWLFFIFYPSLLSSEPDKEEMVRQLVQVLSMEGDAINYKIQSDPFLRSTLNRLSYPSFAKLLDTFASQEQATPSPLPPPSSSPTLRRVAVTMEVSRRVVTATGMQRMQGYAERYMENFAPWVKSHGGWESIVQLEEILECD